MKLASFEHRGARRFGAVTRSGIIPLDGGHWASLKDLLGSPEGLAEARLAVAAASDPIDPSGVRWLPPIPEGNKIFCIGFNYRRHVQEVGAEMPTRPSVFIRFPDAQVGHGQPVRHPVISDQLDFEAELAVVMAGGGMDIPEAEAMAHVAGYSCFGDHSVRDFQKHSSQLTAGKNFLHSGAFGPWVATADEVPDPRALEVIGRLNGREVQRDRVDGLIFTIPALIAYISRFTPLAAGDVIATGTPAGVGNKRSPQLFIQPGDTFEIEIPGVGLLSTPVTAPTRD